MDSLPEKGDELQVTACPPDSMPGLAVHHRVENVTGDTGRMSCTADRAQGF